MLRKIIQIDDEKCNGCGLCAQACHEGAIGMVNGKAKLLRDDYCDGLGDCLPACPTNAISFVTREAAAYDEQAVAKSKEAKADRLPCGCPGTHVQSFSRTEAQSAVQTHRESVSRLSQWPVQIKLAPVNAPYFQNAHLLVAADCTAYAYGNFHEEFIRNRVVLIGCPKLDMTDYAQKLTEIIQNNDIQSVTVVRMEVPCCGGMEVAVRQALEAAGKWIPWQVVTLSVKGERID